MRSYRNPSNRYFVRSLHTMNVLCVCGWEMSPHAVAFLLHVLSLSRVLFLFHVSALRYAQFSRSIWSEFPPASAPTCKEFAPNTIVRRPQPQNVNHSQSKRDAQSHTFHATLTKSRNHFLRTYWNLLIIVNVTRLIDSKHISHLRKFVQRPNHPKTHESSSPRPARARLRVEKSD